jgi:hypothetical protein
MGLGHHLGWSYHAYWLAVCTYINAASQPVGLNIYNFQESWPFDLYTLHLSCFGSRSSLFKRQQAAKCHDSFAHLLITP